MPKLFSTHFNRIRKITSALRARQKMNNLRTIIILSEENRKKVDEAIALLSDAANILESIK